MTLGLLDDPWNHRGVYVLLGRSAEPSKYTADVGKTTGPGLRSRVANHVREKEQWDRALLITSDQGFDSAAIGWLKGRFYDLLQNATAAEV